MALTFEELCIDAGVRIMPVHQKCKADGQTYAGNILRKIYEKHGEGHLLQLLRTFTETDGNAGAIDQFTLQAVSDLMLAHPHWPATGLRWFEFFDTVDLDLIRRKAKANRDAVPQRAAVAMFLYQEMAAHFADVPDSREKKKRSGGYRVCRDVSQAAGAYTGTVAIRCR